MRFGILRTKTVLGANVAGFILGTALFSMFLMLTLYMQQVLGYSAMKTGVAYLAVAGTSIIWANVAAMLVNKVGVRPLIASGMAILAVGLLLFSQVSVDGSYVTDLLPGFLIVALGMALCFVPISIAALAGRQPGRSGNRLRADQHVAAGRRRRRDRAALDDRDLSHRQRGRGRDGDAGGSHLGLPARLPDRRGDRARRCRRGARADPAGGDRRRAARRSPRSSSTRPRTHPDRGGARRSRLRPGRGVELRPKLVRFATSALLVCE